MLFQNGDKIVFTGDSVTDAGRGRPVGEGLWAGVGTGYVRQIENILNVLYPEQQFHTSNTGNGGDTSRGLRARWQTDVLDLKPDYVSIMIGVNDVWRQFDSPAITDMHISPDEYRSNLCDIIERTIPEVKGIILISPYYMEPLKDDMMRKRLDEYVQICEEIAKKYNCIYIDMQKVFDEYLKYRHSSYISWDRVHPSNIGSLIIASEFCKAIGVDRKLF